MLATKSGATRLLSKITTAFPTCLRNKGLPEEPTRKRGWFITMYYTATKWRKLGWLYIYIPRNTRGKKKCLRPPRRKITPHEFCFASGGLKTPLESKKRLKHKSLPKPYDSCHGDFSVVKPTTRDQTPDKQPHVLLRNSYDFPM